MRLRRIVSKRFEQESEGVSVAGAVNAAVSINVNERGAQSTKTSSHQSVTVRSKAAPGESKPAPEPKETS